MIPSPDATATARVKIMARENNLMACPNFTGEQKIDMREKWFAYKEDQKSRGEEGLRLSDFVNGYKAAVNFSRKKDDIRNKEFCLSQLKSISRSALSMVVWDRLMIRLNHIIMGRNPNTGL
jgi:hypothetical protein